MVVGRLIIISTNSSSKLYKTLKKNNLALVADYDDMNSLKAFTDYVINEHPLIDSYVKQSKEFVRQHKRNFVLSKVLSLIT